MRSTAWPDAQTGSSADARSTLAFRFETTVTWAPASRCRTSTEHYDSLAVKICVIDWHFAASCSEVMR